MKEILFLGLILVPALVGCTFAGTVSGNGKLMSRQYDLSDFSRIDVGSTFQAEVVQGEAYNVTITADSNLFDYIKVEKNGSVLSIRLNLRYLYSSLGSRLRARITMPNLEGIAVSGASRANVQGFKSERDLTIDISGASQLDGNIEVGNVKALASGASRVTLNGKGGDASLDASGASRLNLDSFTVNHARVALSGASKATVRAQSQLDYDLTGASTLAYAGDPTLGTRKATGASTARQR